MINANQICEIRILDKRRSSDYIYLPERRLWLLGIIRRAGFYYTFTFHGPELTSVEEIEKSGQLVCIDKSVFVRPRVIIRMSNGDEHIRYFNSLADAKTHVKSTPEFSGIKWIMHFGE